MDVRCKSLNSKKKTVVTTVFLSKEVNTKMKIEKNKVKLVGR